MKTTRHFISLLLLGACAASSAFAQNYEFKGGYPTPETVQRAYDDIDLNRAVQMYRSFYPTVSGAAIFKGNAKVGVIPNKSFGTLDSQPKHVGFTLNSDTPYASLLPDLTDGPMVVDMPPGPLICVAMDLHQRWVADMGLPGPDAGKGGKHLLLPPGYGAGSLYWLGLRDRVGVYLDGGKTYKLTVPQPVPGKLFWSVTVYDAETRSQVQTDQGKAALRSLFEVKDRPGATVDLYFGPKAPTGHEGEWIKTIPSKGRFVYFRIYGPEKPAFDGSWKPGDFEETK